jgi:hypothetical protein
MRRQGIYINDETAKMQSSGTRYKLKKSATVLNMRSTNMEHKAVSGIIFQIKQAHQK